MLARRIEHFHNDGLTFDVVDSGPLDGIPVVLLHGFPQRATSWKAVAARLHDHGVRTFALDQRGYSPGARPRSRFAYALTRLVSDVVALIDVVGQPVHLAGHDWGAAVAWSTAARHPDRITSLTAVSVGHPRAWLLSFALGDQARRSSYMVPFQTRWAERTLSRRGGWGERLMRSWGMDDEMLAQLDHQMVGDGALPGALGWYRSMPLMSRRDFATIRVPTTFVWSDQDATMSRAMARRTERHVHAPYRFVEIAQAKHFLPHDRPDDVADAIIEEVRLSSAHR
jgi:pimeloyl-ACP methyl ester carboxylesterase